MVEIGLLDYNHHLEYLDFIFIYFNVRSEMGFGNNQETAIHSCAILIIPLID